MKFEGTRKCFYIASIVYGSCSGSDIIWSDRSECMIRQNLFPVGAMIRFGTAMRVTATSLSGDFFLHCRVTSSFFSLISSIAVKSYNPLEIRSGKIEGGQDEGKRNLTGELGEHQGVQKFSIRLSRELRMTLVHNEETV